MGEQKAKILVVDDEIAAGRSMKKVLATRGINVDIALTAADGLNRMEDGLFELVLLDIMMPKVNGIELLKTIKKRWSNLNVLMVTGYPSIDTAVEATRLGAIDYIAKPFTPDELRIKVEAALGKAASRKVIQIHPVGEEDSRVFCELGKRECKLFAKHGKACKTRDGRCPMIRKKELKAEEEARPSAGEIGKVAIPLGMPIQSYEEIAKYTGKAYVDALDISGVPMVNWGVSPKRAPGTLGKILVIDDEVVVGQSIRRILGPIGYDVQHVDKPDAAIKALTEKTWDMILLDMRIPGVKGLELLQVIIETCPNIPVIMITGYATVKTAVESIRIGAVDYVPKPFTPDEIHHAVKKGLKRAA